MSAARTFGRRRTFASRWTRNSCSEFDGATRHAANGAFISPTLGAPGLTASLVDTYLMADGTSFTDQPGHERLAFFAETQNRDPRLAQTIRTPGYHRSAKGWAASSPYRNYRRRIVAVARHGNGRLWRAQRAAPWRTLRALAQARGMWMRLPCPFRVGRRFPTRCRRSARWVSATSWS